jgi:murein DD-endopeptidase MepM/ murein hydrolase activator NlpD
MWEFLKNIISKGDGDVTVLVMDEQNPEESSSFRIHVADMIKIVSLVVIISVLLTTLIFFITPLGSLYQQKQDETLRRDVIAIGEKIIALRDSLDARDRQLTDMKEVFRTGADTVFTIRSSTADPIEFTGGGMAPMTRFQDLRAYEMISEKEIIFSGILRSAPVFPTAYPVRGTFTQSFNAESGHFGIDLAARENTEFRSVADGTVIKSGWTITHGYVIYVQHGDGYISVYKHGAKLYKEEGDIVLKGDILGVIGDKGVLSSGSHLHFEIWRNGVPQDPLMYLTN